MMKQRVTTHMRAANPNAFVPKVIVFSTKDPADWEHSLPLKAASLYFAITGKEADAKTISTATRMLISIAMFSRQLIVSKQSDPEEEKKPAGSSFNVNASVQVNINEEGNSPSQASNEVMPSASPIPAPPASEIKEEELSKEIKETIDAIYLLVGFLRDLTDRFINGVERDTLHSNVTARHGHHIISDIAMLENQLSLALLLDVIKYFENSIKRSKDSLLHDNVLQQGDPLISSMEKFRLNFSTDNLNERISLFCWYYSPFYSKKPKPAGVLKLELSDKQHLLDCLHHSLLKRKNGGGEDSVITTGGHISSIPTAKELARSGVHFETNPEGVLEFRFSKPVLFMPALVFDSKMETVVMNLVALERGLTEGKPKPVTRYFQLMNELVEDEGDVRVLKKFGVLRGRCIRGEEVVNFMKRVDDFAFYPSIYPAVEKEIEAMKEFHEMRMRMFLVRYKPAVTWASIAAASLLVTAVVTAKRRR